MLTIHPCLPGRRAGIVVVAVLLVGCTPTPASPTPQPVATRAPLSSPVGVASPAPAVAPSPSPGLLASPSPSVGAVPSPSAVTGGSTVDMNNELRFDPPVLTVPRGTTVTWLNTSSIQHTVTDDASKAQNKADAALPAGAEPWDSGNIDPGGRYQHTFDVAGTYKYFCIPHETAGMLGTIVVTG
jgi:plastocyanin